MEESHVIESPQYSLSLKVCLYYIGTIATIKQVGLIQRGFIKLFKSLEWQPLGFQSEAWNGNIY